MVGDESIGPVRNAGKGAQEAGQRATAWKQPREWLCGLARRPHLAGGQDQVPRVEALGLRDLRQERLSFVALDRDRAESTTTIPREDLVEAPLAEAAVVVIEDRPLSTWCGDWVGLGHARDYGPEAETASATCRVATAALRLFGALSGQPSAEGENILEEFRREIRFP